MADKKNSISFGDYFIVDVSFMPSNPVHRVVAVCDGEDGDTPTFSLYSASYEKLRSHVNPFKKLYCFHIIEKLDKMSEKPESFLSPGKNISLDF